MPQPPRPPDFIILANTRWNRNAEGRGGNSSPQYADVIRARGGRVSYIQKDRINRLTPLEEIEPGPNTVVMCDMPWVDFYLDLFLKLKALDCRTVYRIVDNWLLTPRKPEYDESREIAFIRAADGVFASNPLSIERFREVRTDIKLLRNGVDLDHFWNWQGEAPAEMRRGKPTAVFVTGFWDPEWVDWPALIYAARELPTMAINVLGDASQAKLPALPENVHLLGRRPWSQLPAYFHQADIGIVAYRPARTRYNNPLKVLEYLASGRPVVASRNPSLGDYPYLYFYETPEDFLGQIKRAVSEPVAKEGLRKILENHTWRARLEELLKELGPAKETKPAACSRRYSLEELLAASDSLL
jgi:glycosyltransferase involved in cell wall biosynthesis